MYHIISYFISYEIVLDEGEKSHKGTTIGIVFHNKCKGCRTVLW